jgi:hypothetical protein
MAARRLRRGVHRHEHGDRDRARIGASSQARRDALDEPVGEHVKLADGQL